MEKISGPIRRPESQSGSYEGVVYRLPRPQAHVRPLPSARRLRVRWDRIAVLAAAALVFGAAGVWDLHGVQVAVVPVLICAWGAWR